MRTADLKKGTIVNVTYGTHKGKSGIIERAFDKGTPSARARVTLEPGSANPIRVVLPAGHMVAKIMQKKVVLIRPVQGRAGITIIAQQKNDLINLLINDLTKCMASVEEYKKKYM